MSLSHEYLNFTPGRKSLRTPRAHERIERSRPARAAAAAGDVLQHRRTAAVAHEQLEHYRHEIELAAAIQQHLLPARLPQLSAFEVAAVCRPCQTLGGDFYDLFPLCGGLGIAVGDVSGKGLPASLLLTALRSSLRAHAEDLTDLAQVLARVNDDFARDTRPHEFATLFLGFLDADRRTLTYSSAGHEPPLLVRGGRAVALEAAGMAVGIVEGECYEVETVALEPGDVLAVFTDGVTEGRDANDRLFGADRVRQSLAQSRRTSARELNHDLLTELDWFIGNAPPADDVTLVTVRVN